MSQSHNPKDNQALLQSMLQRLKLQPGRESQACLHTPVPVTSAPTLGKNGERGAANFQKVNNSPINVFGANGIPTKSFGISAADSNFGFKDRERQQPGHSCELDSGLVSFPSHKDNTDKGENRVFGQATLPGITHTGTGQLFPAKSLKDADITSFERTDGEIQGETGSFGSIAGNKDAVTTTGQNQEQGFTPRVYLWSLKGADLNTGGQENKVLHVGNGGIGASAQSKDTQIVQTTTANSSSRRKQRSSDNKTRRWTQKIKERWRERPGSFGKRGKEEGVQGIESSPQTSENLINTSNKDGESIFPSLDSSATSETPPAHSEEQTSDGHIRSSSDFDFGLGSFSLLEEIVTGQEWAKFLNPAVSAPSANQRPSEEPPSQLKITPNPYDSGQSSLILSQQGDGNNQWSFRGSKSSPVSDFSMTQISPHAFLPVQNVRNGADQSEPMEHGLTQSNMQPRPPSFVEPADTLDNPALRSRVHLNRKRQHRSAEGTEASISSLSVPSSHVMDETGVSYHDNVMSPPSHSPSSFTPCGPAPQGVLKQSISRDSVSSMETLTKRRRVEENRRVHFSEQVVAIAPAELDMDATDSEDDLGAEEDSVIEQEFEVEQAAIEEEVPPARRPVLPAWILALKRMNTGRKHR
ncbi:A-kinase anchor protein 200 [Thunnus thynnus]|uniref:A-kinase anchor protein 200 n=1 Tax=Thunnus thynnus TaxID=8237 RepID=UPI003529A671